MKSIILITLALVAVAIAAPLEKEPTKILRSEFEPQADGSYDFRFETNDGTKREEKGEVQEVLDEENKAHNVVVVRGSFSYIDPEGNSQIITYYADGTGYHADGPSIPKVAST